MPAHLRIGELSRRVGVSAELLRAWERRYGLLAPERTAGGFRLYGDQDERRVRRMLEHLDAGLSAAEAARLVIAEPEPESDGTAPAPLPAALAARLRHALDELDEVAGHAALDRLLSALTLETVLSSVVLPYLHELGERWERGEATIAQEHFASNLLRGRLLGLARDWGSGAGPRALLACVPGEQHDLGLICFGLALRTRGWRIAFLGPDTPLDAVGEAATRLRASLVVLSASSPERLEAAGTRLTELAQTLPLVLAGPGVTEKLAGAIGVTVLDGDPVTAAERAARTRGRARPRRRHRPAIS